MKAGVQSLLDSLCALYNREAKQVAWHAKHHLGGQMLVEAAFVALPREQGVNVSPPADPPDWVNPNVGSGQTTWIVVYTSCCSQSALPCRCNACAARLQWMTAIASPLR